MIPLGVFWTSTQYSVGGEGRGQFFSLSCLSVSISLQLSVIYTYLSESTCLSVCLSIFPALSLYLSTYLLTYIHLSTDCEFHLFISIIHQSIQVHTELKIDITRVMTLCAYLYQLLKARLPSTRFDQLQAYTPGVYELAQCEIQLFQLLLRNSSIYPIRQLQSVENTDQRSLLHTQVAIDSI